MRTSHLTRFSTYCFFALVLSILPLVALADGPAEVPGEATGIVALELENSLLAPEAPVMSLATGEATEDASLLPTDLNAQYGICWTSCFPCTSSASCPNGEQCRFGVMCP